MDDKNAWAWVGKDDFAPEVLPEEVRTRTRAKTEKPTKSFPFQIVLGGKPIELQPTEYRLVLFLAGKPYHAFTQQEIFDGIQAFFDVDLISAEGVPDIIRSLRDKLGFFRDYVQTVPHIGYRFKP